MRQSIEQARDNAKTANYFTRRRTLQGLSLTALLPLIESQPLFAQSANPPQSSFGASSTAEEVTVGLDLSGKTALVTGFNSGLGMETARVLAMRGAHVIGTARTQEKAEKASTAIEGKTTPLVCELTDFDSITACSKSAIALDQPIDMLICNAGIMALPELKQKHGLEMHFLVNHMGHYLLTRQLLEQVKKAKQGRVVMLSSLGYKWAPEAGIEFDNLSGERDYEPMKAYGQSKLANALFALELSRRLEGTTTTANSVHPGIINTNLGRHMEPYKRWVANLFGWLFMKSTEEGSATTCYVATNPALNTVSGHYFEDCNPVTPEGPHMRDLDLAKKLWDVSEELTADYLKQE